MKHPDETHLRRGSIGTSSAMISATCERDEISRIARELHDGVVQELCYLRFLSQTLVASKLTKTAQQNLLSQIAAQTDRALESVRCTLEGLGPCELAELDLQTMLAQFTKRLERESSLSIERVGQLDVCLTGYYASDIYRVIQEALRNVVKHARTDRARVRIGTRRRQIVGRVIDGGCGCQQHRANNSHSPLGISNMHARIRGLGGSLKIWSRPNFGTVVEFVVPLCP